MEGDNKMIVFENINKNAIKLFEDKKVRVEWDDEKERWYFSIVDIVAILTDNDFQGARNYWKVLKHRLKNEGNETVTNCNQLKLEAPDGKLRFTDVADTEQILRLIQSIPSKKAEPFKLWLAKVGSERIDEIENPELAQERMKKLYEQKGYSKSWIDKRIRGIAVRQNLTDEWKSRGVEEGREYAILTNEISKAAFGRTVDEYKSHKGLDRENLRDHMTDLELIFSMLGEASTVEIERTQNPNTFEEHKEVAAKGGAIAKNARKELEGETNEEIVSKENYLFQSEIDSKNKKKLEG